MKFDGIDGNLFDFMRKKHGPICYQDEDKLQKIRTALTRFIGSHGGYRRVVIKVVRHALEFHRTWHDGDNTVRTSFDSRPVCPAHAVLLVALRLCQKYDLANNQGIMEELLTASYECEGGFDRFVSFLDPLIFPFEIDSILFPFPTAKLGGNFISKQHLSALEFYLRSAQGIRSPVEFTQYDWSAESEDALTVRTEEVGLVEMPILSCRGSTPLLLACHSICSEAVLLLLRHGADPFRPGQIQHLIGMQFQHPLYVLVTKLNASVFWRTHNQHLHPCMRDQFIEKQRQTDHQLALCLKYICRAVLRVPITICRPIRPSNGPRDPMTFNIHPSFADLIPETRSTSPAELKHSCRCLVRRTLLDNRQLPSGIHNLPLPRYIKAYLDLRYD